MWVASSSSVRNVRPIEIDVDRQLTFEQSAHLHRRGMGTQQLPGAVRRDIEGVLLAARRVIGREVQGVEVELLGLDLGSLGQFPPHRDEGVGDVLGQDRDRVACAGRLAGRGQRHVDALGDQHRRVPLGAQRRQSFVVACWASPREVFTSRPASARSALGTVANAWRASASGERSPRCSVLARANASRSAAACEGLPGCVDRGGQRLRRQGFR